MDKRKRKKLEAKGFEITTVTEFLELTPDEAAIIELRLDLSNALKNYRIQSELTQEEFAKRLKTSQSRVAKMEAGDKSVTLDLLIKNLLKSGFNRKELSEIIQA
ncbi:MAG: helix-turn-helix transcriptional regulator [Acidobacteriota bacterium]|nr:helix-turn-helix transcriptional regulator [Acidobacteriota bacterium]